jgi:short-subunit dehydrogenase
VTSLVTGASSGIGAATATMLAQAGHQVRLAGRDTDALRQLAGRIGGDWLAGDLTEAGAAKSVADWAGQVDVLVCNAGVGWAGALPEMPLPKVDELVELNLTAPLKLTSLLLPSMLHRRRGHLVFVSSIAGCLGVADEAVYSATKAGLRTFADSVRLAHPEIGVSVVFPGVIDTPFFDRRGKPYERRSPKPVPADRVATAILDAIRHRRSEVFVPRWLRFPARLHGAMPGLVQRLERRFG